MAAAIRASFRANSQRVIRLLLTENLTLWILDGSLRLAITVGTRALLFGVSALDPIVFIATPLVLSLVDLLASLVPARRAMLVDPVTALRE